MSDIRLATTADAAAARDVFAPYAAETPVSFETSAPTTAEMADRIAATLPEHPWLVCEANGDVVGYAKASRLRSAAAYAWTVELSVYVADDARRSGVGRGLYESLFAVLERQGFVSAYAVTTVPNPETVGFHDRMGFEPLADFPALGYVADDWRDVRWWRREISEPDGEPDPTRTVTALRDDPAVDWTALVGTGEDVLGA